MANVFSNVSVLPSYSRGFSFFWDIEGNFNDRGPWEFTVQEAQAPAGPWKTISPVIKNACLWREEKRAPVSKSNVLYFRIYLKTPEGKYASTPVQPYGTLSRRDFLLAREVIRQSILHSKGMAGTMCRAYLLSTFGPKCSHCIDPITGMVRDSHCKFCMGTGRDPAYNGPYDLWVDFSEDSQHKVETGKTGTVEKKSFQARAVGNPSLKYGDIIVVPSSDKRYYVDTVAVTTEIRRIPIIQTLTLEEAPQTDKVYDL